MALPHHVPFGPPTWGPTPYVYRLIEVLRVVDGDTIDARIDLGFGLQAAFRFRLAHVDAPETRGPSSEAGARAREFVEQWLAERTGEHLEEDVVLVVTAKSHPSTVGLGDGAFGRWAADFIDINGVWLSTALIACGLAVDSRWEEASR